MHMTMNRAMTATVALMGISLLAESSFGAIDWQAYAIRAANDGVSGYGTVTEDVSGNGVSFLTEHDGQKLAYGTNAFSGMNLGSIQSVSWKVESASVTANAPYLNVWITDGLGNFGIVAVDGSYNGATLAGLAIKVHESSVKLAVPAAGGYDDWSWLATALGMPAANTADTAHYLYANGLSSGTKLTWGDLGNLMIKFPTTPISGAAPQNTTFSLIYGDTLGNYVDSYSLSELQVAAVPEAATLSVLALGASALLVKRKK